MFNSERVYSKHFVSGKPAPWWYKRDVDWVPTLQLAKKNFRAKLDHNANTERAVGAKKRCELARGRTRARTEAAENVESWWKAVFLLSRSPLVSQEEWNRNEGNEEAFSSNQAAIAVSRSWRNRAQPKTIKDAECQPSSFTTCLKRADRKPRIRIFLTLTI